MFFDIVGTVMGAVIAAAVIATVGFVAAPVVAAAIIVGTAAITGAVVDVTKKCVESTKDVGRALVKEIDLKMPNGFPIKFTVESVKATVRVLPTGDMRSTLTYIVRGQFRNGLNPSYSMGYFSSKIYDVLKAQFGQDNVKETLVSASKYVARGTVYKLGDVERYVIVSASIYDPGYANANAPFYFIGEDERGLTTYVVAVLVDGRTGGVKAIDVRRFNPGATYFEVVENRCTCCDALGFAIGCPFYTVGYWLGLEQGWDKHSVCSPPSMVRIASGYIIPSNYDVTYTFQFTFDGYVDEGDYINVYFLSSAFIRQLKRVCESGNVPDDLSDLCNTVKGLCDGGYVLSPELFEETLKMFGYYNNDVIRLAIAIANGGYLADSYTYVTINEITYDVHSTKLKVITREPVIENGAISGISANVETVDLTAGGSYQFDSMGAIDFDVPVPYALTVMGGTNNNYYLILNPLGLNLGTDVNIKMIPLVTTRGVIGRFGANGMLLAQLPDYELALGLLMAYGGKINIQVAKSRPDGTPLVIATVSADSSKIKSGELMKLNALIGNIAKNAASLAPNAKVATAYPVLDLVANVVKAAKIALLGKTGTKEYCIEIKNGGMSVQEGSCSGG